MSVSVHSSSFIAKSKSGRFCPFPESDRAEEFDVFLCFTGKTRGGFTSHLVKELKRAGVRTFTDQLLPRGESISDALIGRIKVSRSTMVVVSKDFTDSTWCLDEVMESFRCQQEKIGHGHGDHPIFPIFYKVDPSEIRHLRGRIGQYFALHEESYGTNSGKVTWWRTCLVLLSNIAGWHFTTGGNESELIQMIVEDVVKTLGIKKEALISNVSTHI